MTKRRLTKEERGARWVAKRQREAAFYGAVAATPLTVYRKPATPTARPVTPQRK